MEKQEKTREVKLHPKQFEVFNFNTQYAAAIAGVQSGKTFVGCYWAANQIAENPEADGLICAPTYKILHHSTLQKFFTEFPQYRKWHKEQKGEIELPSGHKIFIRSMDDPLGVEGMTIKWAWMDEAGQMPIMAWTVVRSRTSTTKGKVLITTTPYNMGWLYQDFYLPWQRGEDKDLTVVSWASTDSPYFPKDFYDKEQQRLTAQEFARRYQGTFSKMEGLVYDVHNWHIIEPKEQRADIVLAGIDWGWTNPAAITVIKVHDGHYYVVDEWYEVGKTTTEIIEKCLELQKKWNINRFYADSANPEKIAEANKGTGLFVLPAKKERDSITAGISIIRNLLLERRLHVFNTLSNTLNEFNSYHYPEVKDDKTPKEEPEPKDNHLMDCIRYTIQGYGVSSPLRHPIGKNWRGSIANLLDTTDIQRVVPKKSFE